MSGDAARKRACATQAERREDRSGGNTMRTMAGSLALPMLLLICLAGDAQPSKPEAKAKKAAKGAKPARKARTAKKAASAKKAARKPKADRTNKKVEVIAMMQRTKGATLDEIMKATGWQRHTVRGFVSILGSKGGEKIESSKNASGERTYKIAK